MKLRPLALLLAMFAATSVGAMGTGCSSSSSEDEEDVGALADEDASGWEMDYAKFNAAFPDEAMPVREGHPEDAYSVLVDLGEKKIRANTHMFKRAVNLIPYANPEVEATAAAAAGGRGDAVIAEYIRPGEVGIMIKHHRPEHRTLALNGGGPEMKEHFKLQDSHIGIIMGVERNGKPGAISVNNPKTYEQGAFGNDHYPMVFVKPTFPAGVTADMQKAYVDNIRTMAVLFNTVSAFPGDYNGGDPLAARSPKEIQRHVAMMIKAIGGDTNAQQWFTKPENKIYCAELAFVSLSAGILVPLSKSRVVGLEGDGLTITEADWNAFAAAVDGGWPFAQAPIPSADGSPNPRLADLKAYKPNFAAFESLKPISEVAAAPKRADGVPSKGLALEPMTMADIVQHFLRTHVPRDPALQKGTELEGMGERIAPMQGAVLAKMEEGLFESMKIPAAGQQGGEQRQRSITDDAQLMGLPAALAQGQQVRFTVKDVFDALVKVTSKSYGDYGEAQKNIQPWLMVARKVTGPRGDSGEGLFAPPSLFHVITQGAHPGGYLGLKYLGHGVHFSYVKAPSRPAETPGTPQATPGAAQETQQRTEKAPPAQPFGNNNG